MSEPIDLNHAFPDHVELMHTLRGSDGHFQKLYTQYMELEKELGLIAKQAETPDDAFVEELKKKRLATKDEMMSILNKAA